MGAMPKEPRDEQLTIRLPRRVRVAIEARAESERRSVADVINNILADSLAPAPAAGRRG